MKTPTDPAETAHPAELEVIAFVDLFNVSSSPRTNLDYEDALLFVGDLIRDSVAAAAPTQETAHVTCRLYGGFVDVNGGPTAQYSGVLRKLRVLRGLESGVRIVPEVARTLRCRPLSVLLGTYKNGHQKMVDQMMAQDAYDAASDGEYGALLMISDDEDFVPCVITIASRTVTPVWWLRRRAETRHDAHFREDRVTLLTDRRWK